jgi:hypothetical protein
MKLQFGPFLITLALLSAPPAWSQAGSADSPQSGSNDSSQQQSSKWATTRLHSSRRQAPAGYAGGSDVA